MIAFFPQIYYDEILYSVFARYYDKSGYTSFRDAAQDIFINPKLRVEREFIKNLNQDCIAVLEKQMGLEDIIEKHTMTPYYTRFYNGERKKRIMQGLKSQKQDCNKLIGVMQNRTTYIRKFRLCPMCSAEDRKKYGECYFHRSHLMWNIAICPQHHCKLYDVDIPLDVSSSSTAISAEAMCENVDLNCIYKITNKIEIKYAEYCEELFQIPGQIDMSSIATYIKHYLIGSKYLSSRGEHTYFSVLYEDMLDFYKDTSIMEPINKLHIQRSLMGTRLIFYEMVAILVFLNIKVEELYDLPIEVKSPEQLFDEEIQKLKNDGWSRNSIAKYYKVATSVIDIALGKNNKGKRMQANECKKSKNIDWEEKDKELLASVKQIVDGFYENKSERPKNLSIYSVRKKLGISQSWLKKMPKCIDYIESHRITQKELDIKALAWAIEKVHHNGDDLAIWRICQIIKIGRERVIEAIKAASELLGGDDYNILMQEINADNE